MLVRSGGGGRSSGALYSMRAVFWAAQSRHPWGGYALATRLLVGIVVGSTRWPLAPSMIWWVQVAQEYMV